MTFRRPSPSWCTDTAIRLLKITTGELLAHPKLLTGDEARALLEAAATLDQYGQRIAAQTGEQPTPARPI